MVPAAKAVSAVGKRRTKAPASKAAARKKPAAKKSRRR
jgi:hypothetical protein